MYKRMLFVVLTVLMLVLSACAAPPPIDEAKAQFCADLGAYGRSVAALRQIDATTTVEEVKAMQQAIDDAWAQVQQSGQTVEAAQVATMGQQQDALRATLNTITDETTLSAAAATIQTGIAGTLSSYVDIATTTCTYGAEE